MEQENKSKRARDEDNNNISSTSREKTSAKKQNLNNYNLMINHKDKDKDKDKNKEKEEEEDDIFQKLEYSCTPVEVFDFPWLKEGGVISKSEEEDWKFEDTFSLLLEDSCTNNNNPGVLEMLSGQSMCQASDQVKKQLDYVEDKLEDDVLRFEGDAVETVDGIWSSLLNQPLSAGFINDDYRGV